MKVSIICAMTERAIIGINNKLPWNIKDEMIYFKKKTVGHPVIMGRSTFDSIGKPLPGRTNIVITRNKKCHSLNRPQDKLFYVNSLAEAIDMCDDGSTSECFIIGGCQIYEQALHDDIVDRMYLNFIKEDYDGDAVFPEFDRENWVMERVDETHEEFAPTLWIRRQDVYGV